jgi:hypothetical protein
MDALENFTEAQIARFESNPSLYAAFETALESDQSVKFALTLDRSGVLQKWAADKCREYMTNTLGGHPRLCDALIPEYPLGCRRMTPAPGYLEAMRHPRVRVVTDKITKFVDKGVELGTGEVLEVDVVMCATGYDASFIPEFPIYGRRGNLRDVWEGETPKAYMSLAVAGMPNFFSESLFLYYINLPCQTCDCRKVLLTQKQNS